MKRFVYLCFAFAVCALAEKCGIAQSPKEGKFVLPGKSVAGVTLGPSLTDFKRVFPRHPDVDERLYDSVCTGSYYQWIDLDLGATGVTAYLRDDRIFQFSVQTP